MDKSRLCKERVAEELKSRIADLKKLWKLYQADPEAGDEELGTFNEYGLCFDYVARRTFSDQKQGYFRYQLSRAGPSDEFRFYCDAERNPYKIEYWFLDWFDGAKIVLHGRNEELLREIFNDFREVGTVDAEFERW